MSVLLTGLGLAMVVLAFLLAFTPFALVCACIGIACVSWATLRIVTVRRPGSSGR